jgi:hypothetical protein
MPRVEFEPTISVFDRSKATHTLDHAAAVIGFFSDLADILKHLLWRCQGSSVNMFCHLWNL